jgi:hypothetical protein
MADTLVTDLEIVFLCYLLEGPGANLKVQIARSAGAVMRSQALRNDVLTPEFTGVMKHGNTIAPSASKCRLKAIPGCFLLISFLKSDFQSSIGCRRKSWPSISIGSNAQSVAA